MAQILAEDDGPGISEEELQEIFKPFYRAAHACTSRPTGVGLGLAISERALNLHRGSITACNRSGGKGLQVTIQIPLLDESRASRQQVSRSGNWKKAVGLQRFDRKSAARR